MTVIIEVWLSGYNQEVRFCSAVKGTKRPQVLTSLLNQRQIITIITSHSKIAMPSRVRLDVKSSHNYVLQGTYSFWWIQEWSSQLLMLVPLWYRLPSIEKITPRDPRCDSQVKWYYLLFWNCYQKNILIFSWPCLHQWLETKPFKTVCPVCKAAISKEKVIPLYGRGSTQEDDPRNKVRYDTIRKVSS